MCFGGKLLVCTRDVRSLDSPTLPSPGRMRLNLSQRRQYEKQQHTRRCVLFLHLPSGGCEKRPPPIAGRAAGVSPSPTRFPEGGLAPSVPPRRWTGASVCPRWERLGERKNGQEESAAKRPSGQSQVPPRLARTRRTLFHLVGKGPDPSVA